MATLTDTLAAFSTVDAEQQLKEALDALQESDSTLTREYTEALEVVPHLVESETDMLKFLRTEQFDPVKAARRLALYWKYRKVVFGQRWLLPMVQTGSGALTRDAIELLRKGFIAILSKPSETPVFMIDATRRDSPTADHIIASVAFYVATTVGDERFQTEGLVLLYLIQSRGHWNMKPHPTGYWTIIQEAMPMRIKKILMIPLHEPGKQHLLDYLSFQASRVVEFRSKCSSQVVAGDTLEGTVKLLEEMGISRRILPQCLGGTWSDEHLHRWVRSRLTLEDIMSAASPILNQIHAPRGSSALLIKRKEPVNGQEQGETDQKDFIRKRNALYSRRKYHKEKLEMLALPEQCKALEERKAELQALNRHLSNLLFQAETLVSMFKSVPHDWEDMAGTQALARPFVSPCAAATSGIAFDDETIFS